MMNKLKSSFLLALNTHFQSTILISDKIKTKTQPPHTKCLIYSAEVSNIYQILQRK